MRRRLALILVVVVAAAVGWAATDAANVNVIAKTSERQDRAPQGDLSPSQQDAVQNARRIQCSFATAQNSMDRIKRYC